MTPDIRCVAFALVLAVLSSTDCGSTNSSDVNRRALEPAGAQVAGHPIVKWHKAKDAGTAIFSPGAIFEDGSAQYWVGNNIGLYMYNEKRDIWKGVSREALGWRVANIIQIAESNDGSLWIRSMQVLPDNLRVFNGERGYSVPRFFESRVSMMFKGRSGKLWFGAVNDLVAYDGRRWSRRVKPSELIKSPERLYISINAGLEDSDGFIWIAIPGGVMRFDPYKNDVKNSFEQASVAHVRCMYQDQIGDIWFGGSDGSVSVYEKSKNSLRSYELSERVSLSQKREGDRGLPLMVNAILQDETGHIMIATTRGLVTVDPTGNVWQAFTNENSPLPAGSITALMKDQNGRIWVGTSEGILVLGR